MRTTTLADIPQLHGSDGSRNPKNTGGSCDHARFAALSLRWAARLGSLASLALLAAFLFGGGEQILPSTLREAVSMALFPGCVAAGMLLAWRWELAGGLLCVAGLAAFYAWMALASGRVPLTPYFALFAAPGFIFLICGTLERIRRRTACASPLP